MSESTPATSFNPAFLEQMKKRSQNSWRCPRCFAYNDNSLAKCRSCEMDKPTLSTDNSSVKRSAEKLPENDEKKPKTTGFVFKPSGEQQSKSIFDSAPMKTPVAATTNFPTTFKKECCYDERSCTSEKGTCSYERRCRLGLYEI